MLALERMLRPGCGGAVGAFRYEAANDETEMATGGPNLPPAVRAAEASGRALP